MKVNYHDLTNYLNQSDDWHLLPEDPGWLTYEGPAASDDLPAQIGLPNSDVPLKTQDLVDLAVGILASVKGIHRDRMADMITPTSARALMDAIRYSDCEPSVFTVTLQASGHIAGFQASICFRTYNPQALRSISTQADTPEEALHFLLHALRTRWGPCPTCGQQRHGEEQEEPPLTS